VSSGILVALDMKEVIEGGSIVGATLVERFMGWHRMISDLSTAKRRVKVII
jgi:hypothetical protein